MVDLERAGVAHPAQDWALARIQPYRKRHRRLKFEMPTAPLLSHTLETPRHRTHYYECGPTAGPLMLLLHGWPATGLLWRAQMEQFASAGWHCIAPDLRGYGNSSTPSAKTAYTMKEIVADMTELHDHLGGTPAVWVGHDWGSVVAAQLVAHHRDRSRAVALISLAYQPDGHALRTVVPLVDRTIYPADQYPDGQWDYYRYYTTHFEVAVADLDADKAASLASIFQRGDPAAVGKVSKNATVTRDGGRFGKAHQAPRTEPDTSLWPREDFTDLVEAFESHSFRPACAWYLNDEANVAYAREAPNHGRLTLPVLFVNGTFDQICTITANRQGNPMRQACPDLTVTDLDAGHWLPLERKPELTNAIQTWLREKQL